VQETFFLPHFKDLGQFLTTLVSNMDDTLLNFQYTRHSLAACNKKAQLAHAAPILHLLLCCLCTAWASSGNRH